MQKPPFASIKKEIDRAKHILVCAHVNPDPDAVGSVLSLGVLLVQRGATVSFFITGFRAERYAGVPEISRIKTSIPRRKVDLVIGLDYGRMQRLEIDALIARDHPRILTIDHHPHQDQQGSVVWVDASKSSVSEMVYDLAKGLHWPLFDSVPFSILFGIIGDTVGLSTPGVTHQLLAKVADLMRRGASLEKAQSIRQEISSLPLLKLSAKAIARAKVDFREEFAYAWITMKEWKSAGVEPSSFTGIANDLKLVRGIKVSLVLAEHAKKWYGHLRSRADCAVDLGKVAEAFGGGGHTHAAGFTSTRSRAAIIKKVRALLKRGS